MQQKKKGSSRSRPVAKSEKWRRSASPFEFGLRFPKTPSVEASGRSKITASLFTRSMALHSLALLMLSVYNIYHFECLVNFSLVFHLQFSTFVIQIIYSMKLALMLVSTSSSPRMSFSPRSMASTVSKSKFKISHIYIILILI